MSEDMDANVELPLHGAGDRLRNERERQELTLEQVAAETRIPLRHLQLIEKGDFAGLPARTYAIGFARTYAKMLGLDEGEITDAVRAELSEHDPADRHRASRFEPGDPARVPSSKLAWISAVAAILLVVGIGAFYYRVIAPGAGPPPLKEEPVPAKPVDAGAVPAAKAGAATPAGGEVVFTALDENVWIKFYDANGEQLLQKQMAKGERYTVPADAEGPMAWTGRPDAFAITVGGQSVPKLADDDVIVRDVPVTAAALLARDTAPATAED
jgi:cytoskeletal protein RodZ